MYVYAPTEQTDGENKEKLHGEQANYTNKSQNVARFQ